MYYAATTHELVQLRIEAVLLESIRLLRLLYGRSAAYCVELQPQHHQPERMQLVESNERFCKDHLVVRPRPSLQQAGDGHRLAVCGNLLDGDFNFWALCDGEPV